jgi:hypothetical protein
MAILCVPGYSGAADSRTEAIHLSVIDEKNLPVSDATVELRLGDKLASTASTDATGKVTLTVNAPGKYSLNIQKKGYQPAETTLAVSEGSAAQDVDVVLSSVALIKQNVEVKGEASNPITETSSAPATLAPTQAKDTPLRPATLVDALPLIPGIVRGPDGSVRIAGFGEDPNGQTIRTIAREADVRQERALPEWNRCNQRLTETRVSNITHYGIGHFQRRNLARDTFLAVTHVPHPFAA